jgi:activator of 2-hydroxyglutaryl-CoA dehydratase
MHIILNQEEERVTEFKADYWRWPETHFVNPDIEWKKGKFVTAGVDVGSVSMQTVVMVDVNCLHTVTHVQVSTALKYRKCVITGFSKYRYDN